MEEQKQGISFADEITHLQKGLLFNIESIESLMNEGNYNFGHLPKELQNKDCCEAYKRGIQYSISMLNDLEICNQIINLVRIKDGKQLTVNEKHIIKEATDYIASFEKQGASNPAD